jgi:hypothetical protein
MVFFERTSAVIDKTLKDLQRLSFWVYLLVQTIFVGLYAFKIYASREKIVYLVLYSILAGLSLFAFVFYLSTYKNKKAQSIIKTKRGIRIGKYSANAIMIIVILVEFAQGGASELSIILSGISMVSFAAQILIECLRVFYERYAKLLEVALNKDIAGIETFTHPLKAIDAPLEALSAKLNGAPKEEMDETERYVEGLKDDYQAKKKIHKAERSRKDKAQIKGHLMAIKEAVGKKLHHRKKEDVKAIEPPKENQK